jgi:hypothetical protein
VDSGLTAEEVYDVDMICEMLCGLFEHAFLERRHMPRYSWDECWSPYIEVRFLQSPQLRDYFVKCDEAGFYVKEFRDLVSGFDCIKKHKLPQQQATTDSAEPLPDSRAAYEPNDDRRRSRKRRLPRKLRSR